MYTPPTRADIETQIITAIEGRIGQTVPIFPRAFVRVLAAALAGAIWLLYQVNAWAMRQAFPATADAEALLYLGDWYDMPRNPSVAAILGITISGTNGTTVPAGTLWTAEGIVYSQLAVAVIAAGIASAEVEALTAGEATTLALSTAVQLPSPLAGVTGAVVASVVDYGEDEEPLGSYRTRIVSRMRNQPQGGAVGDYVRWCMEVSGIAGAHVQLVDYDVIAYPLAALDGSARIPDAPKLAEVQAYIQASERRPLCASVYALAASERTADVTITGLSPADAATQARILASMTAYFYAAYPLQYPDDPSPTNVVSVAALWSIIIASGAVATGVTLAISGIGSGVTTYTLPIGEIIELGTITWA